MQFIYVVKRADLPAEIPRTGIRFADPDEITRFSGGFFMERAHAEEDPDFKQIIPYCVLVRGPEVFVFRRLRGGGEKRLHHLRSIGVGGHIEPGEVAGEAWTLIERAARREIEEEVEISPHCHMQLQYRCILNDDSDAVGSVHLGVVFLLELPAGTDVRVRETEVLEGGFVSMERLRLESFEDFESWSRMLLESDFLPYEQFRHEP